MLVQPLLVGLLHLPTRKVKHYHLERLDTTVTSISMVEELKERHLLLFSLRMLLLEIPSGCNSPSLADGVLIALCEFPTAAASPAICLLTSLSCGALIWEWAAWLDLAMVPTCGGEWSVLTELWRTLLTSVRCVRLTEGRMLLSCQVSGLFSIYSFIRLFICCRPQDARVRYLLPDSGI